MTAAAPVPAGPPPPVEVAFASASQVFETAVAGVPTGAWDDPSPCAGWTVRDVVGHVIGSMVEITAFAAGQPFSRAAGPPGEAAGADPLAALRAVTAPARAAVAAADLDRPADTPHGPGTLAGALAFPVADLAVHAWDVAHATGRHLRLPDDLLAHVVTTASQVPEEVLRRPDLFGPARPAPDGADATTRLVAWLGRDVTGEAPA